MERIRCFLLERTALVHRSLRRYRYSDLAKCERSGYSYHNAEAAIDTVEDVGDAGVSGDLWPHTDQRWPTTCACGYVFQESDQWQLRADHLWRRSDSGLLCLLRDAPVGAMWNAFWLADRSSEYKGDDGRCLIVRTPGGEWMIDGRASNCDSPCANCGVQYKDHEPSGCKTYKDARPHHCWVRAGEPPDLTVSKNGITCGAGAGSIMAGDYHGFLRGGYLERC